MNFQQAVQIVLKHEGGYVNHPSDPGGATNFGITERVARRHGFKGHMRELPLSFAIEVYRQDYWAAIKGDELGPLGFHVFDAAVNSGPAQAIRWLQRTVGTKEDGILGPITLAAAKNADFGHVVKYNAHRLNFLAGLSTFPTFGRGWVRRITANMLGA